MQKLSSRKIFFKASKFAFFFYLVIVLLVAVLFLTSFLGCDGSDWAVRGISCGESELGESAEIALMIPLFFFFGLPFLVGTALLGYASSVWYVAVAIFGVILMALAASYPVMAVYRLFRTRAHIAK